MPVDLSPRTDRHLNQLPVSDLQVSLGPHDHDALSYQSTVRLTPKSCPQPLPADQLRTLAETIRKYRRVGTVEEFLAEKTQEISRER